MVPDMELLMSIPGWNLLIPIVSIAFFQAVHLVADRAARAPAGWRSS